MLRWLLIIVLVFVVMEAEVTVHHLEGERCEAHHEKNR